MVAAPVGSCTQQQDVRISKYKVLAYVHLVCAGNKMVLHEDSTIFLLHLKYDTLPGQFIDVNNAQAKRIWNAKFQLCRDMIPGSLCKCEQNGKPLDPSEQQSAHEVLVALVV